MKYIVIKREANIWPESEMDKAAVVLESEASLINGGQRDKGIFGADEWREKLVQALNLNKEGYPSVQYGKGGSHVWVSNAENERMLIATVVDDFSKEQQDNLASATAVIGFYLGFKKVKLGNEGLMLHYELVQQIAEKFCEKYPYGYDWESHRDGKGEDWDVECEMFADEMINKHPSIFWPDNSYYDEKQVAYIAFGKANSRIVSDLSDHEPETIVEAYEQLDKVTFNSEAEMSAYLKGLEDQDGWDGYYWMDQKEFKEFQNEIYDNDKYLKKYVVNVHYQTPSGNPNSKRKVVEAHNDDEAFEKASAPIRKRGSSIQCCDLDFYEEF